MYPDGQKRLITGKVYRYKNTGKLVVEGGWGYYLDLDKRLNFTNRPPHKINPTTEIEETHWRIELECEGKIHDMKWRYIRSYSVNGIKLPIGDESIPLEKRLNVSPSDFFNDDEKKYIGEYMKTGSWKIRLLVTAIITGIFYFVYQPLCSLVSLIGIPLTVRQIIIEPKQKSAANTYNQKVDQRKQEVLDAKERIKRSHQSEIYDILKDFSKWQRLDGKSFEIAVGELYKEMGYFVEYTQTSNDGGIDLLLKKDTEHIGVQCKAYNKNVGVAAGRELHGVRSQWSDLTGFILVGLHGFSRQARKFAQEHDIGLFSIERDQFKIG